MIWLLIGTLVLGVAAASVVFVLTRLLPGRIPRWLMPASAGAAMLLFSLYNDYAWADRLVAEFPADFTEAGRFGGENWWRPWTYLAPAHTRVRAVAGVQTNPAVPNLVLGEVALFERYEDTEVRPMAFDCQAGAFADRHPGMTFDADGRPQGLNWISMPLTDPLMVAACASLGAAS